ncbi:methylglyoxal reductase [Klebsiella pneumoniae subsp. ozaenae]|uniref:Methylglyoxal reductase n=1 Tax=Klebsiella pneumoniae subsp. ozaenae TaxID=574 RepID=A0A377YYN9_KLEPO|nr:methylglyoxal reductase [Klebsiella pneumoniae subsp. ozaenae]
MTHPTVIKLHNGNLMPQLGLGVWKAGNEEVVSAIHKALEVGYRSFDTAAAYQNETGVGNALHSAGVNRDELFITTKLWNDDQKRPHEALKESLSKLKLDYVDLYLIHWPVPAIGHYVEAWQALIELQQQGLTKSIGVCNFQVPHLQKLIDETGVAPGDQSDRTPSTYAAASAARVERHPQDPDRILEPAGPGRRRRLRSKSHPPARR